MHLRHDARSVREARQFVASALRDARVESSVALLLTSELASNVVQHARTGFKVVVEVIRGLVHVEVHDGVPVTDFLRNLIERHPGAPPATAIRGRGLMLLTRSARACGIIENADGGKAIWFDITPDGGSPAHS